MAKFKLVGLHPDLLAFLASWLEVRISEVMEWTVQGQFDDGVFQGTVLRPPLWNCFYKDARRAAQGFDLIWTVFDDDFNCFRQLKRWKQSEVLRGDIELKGAQRESHLGGEQTRLCSTQVQNHST